MGRQDVHHARLEGSARGLRRGVRRQRSRRQPTLLTLVVTDGEADDWRDFEPVLEKASAKRVFVVAIVGHGRKHDATLTAYQQAATKNAVQDKFGKVHVEVVSFDAVTDPDEIALDLITLVS